MGTEQGQVRRWRARSQHGETLIESLLALVILLVVGLAAASGMFTVTDASARHKESGVAETLLRTAAEGFQNPDPEPGSDYEYKDWAGCEWAPDGTYPDSTDLDSDLPTELGYDFGPPTVKFWTAEPLYGGQETVPPNPQPVETSFRTCQQAQDDAQAANRPIAATDSGLQEITLTVRTPSDGSETLTFLKRRS